MLYERSCSFSKARRVRRERAYWSRSDRETTIVSPIIGKAGTCKQKKRVWRR